MNSELYRLQDERRKIWAYTRSYLETDNFKHQRYGRRSRSHWTIFSRLTVVLGFLLKATGMYARGYSNAKNIIVNKMELYFPDLPKAFNPYNILHLTDLHLDTVNGISDIICDRIKDLKYDLCVLTGDYREKTHGGIKQILDPMKKIVRNLNAKDGTLAVLGNHDTYMMVDPMEEMGIKVLTNETFTIKRDNEQIAVTGIDDPHYYYTDQAVSSMEEDNGHFKIVLVHSPELYDAASDNGYSLYLCGHTHGGQICLPGGIPVITHLYNGRKFSRGLWSYSNMKGYTSHGCGTVTIPIRFNSQSEIPLITLKSGVGYPFLSVITNTNRKYLRCC